MDNLYKYARQIVRSLYGNEIKVHKAKESAFNYTTNVLDLNLRDEADKNDDLGFYRHLRYKHHCRFMSEFSPMIWTIFHELGHYETQDSYNDKDYNIGLGIKGLLGMCTYETMTNSKDLQDLYYNTKEEWVATEWAIKFVKKNKAQVKKWSEDLESLR